MTARRREAKPAKPPLDARVERAVRWLASGPDGPVMATLQGPRFRLKPLQAIEAIREAARLRAAERAGPETRPSPKMPLRKRLVTTEMRREAQARQTAEAGGVRRS